MATLIDWMPDRRRSARVELLAHLQGQLLALDEVVRVRQVSAGGLQLETSAPLSLREEHELRLAFNDRSVIVRARVLHSRVSIDSDHVTYVSGVEFISPSPDAVALVTDLLLHLAA